MLVCRIRFSQTVIFFHRKKEGDRERLEKHHQVLQSISLDREEECKGQASLSTFAAYKAFKPFRSKKAHNESSQLARVALHQLPSRDDLRYLVVHLWLRSSHLEIQRESWRRGPEQVSILQEENVAPNQGLQTHPWSWSLRISINIQPQEKKSRIISYTVRMTLKMKDPPLPSSLKQRIHQRVHQYQVM